MSNSNQTDGSKPVPLYRRHGSKAECYSKATVPAMRAVQTPAAPFIPVKMTNPPIPREEEDDGQ